MSRRRLATVAALTALALCAPATAQADDCAGADVVPAAANVAVVGQATLCLLNQQRAAHGVGALVENATLSSASAGYSQRMVAQGFFDHESPDGGTLVDRLTGAGYLGDDDPWVVGENIGWGQGALATARSMVGAWMASPGHRANLLSGDFTEIGLGLALGTPADQAWGATFTTDFGAGAAKPAAPHARAKASAVRKKPSRHASCARAASTRRSGPRAKPSSTACARAARVRRR